MHYPLTLTRTQIIQLDDSEIDLSSLLSTLPNSAPDEPLALHSLLENWGLEDVLWFTERIDPLLARKLACAFAWRVRHLIQDARSVEALSVAWLHANGEGSEAQAQDLRDLTLAALNNAEQGVRDAFWSDAEGSTLLMEEMRIQVSACSAALHAVYAHERCARDSARSAQSAMIGHATWLSQRERPKDISALDQWHEAEQAERNAQIDLTRRALQTGVVQLPE